MRRADSSKPPALRSRPCVRIRRRPWRLRYRNSNKGNARRFHYSARHKAIQSSPPQPLFRRKVIQADEDAAENRGRTAGLVACAGYQWPCVPGASGGGRAAVFFFFVWGCLLWLLLLWAFAAALRLGFGCLVVRGCFALALAVRCGLFAAGGRRSSLAALRLWALRLPCCVFGLRLWARAGAWLWLGCGGRALSAGGGAFAAARLGLCLFLRCCRRRGGRGLCLRFGGLCFWRGRRGRRLALALRAEPALAFWARWLLLAGFFFVLRNSNPIAILRATEILRANRDFESRRDFESGRNFGSRREKKSKSAAARKKIATR